MQKQLAMTTKGMHTSRVKRILNSKVAELGEFLQCDKTRINFFPFQLYSTCSLAGLPDCAQDGSNICHLQAVIGPCSAHIERWYNVDVRDCRQFI